jgi:hypothetical protein
MIDNFEMRREALDGCHSLSDAQGQAAAIPPVSRKGKTAGQRSVDSQSGRAGGQPIPRKGGDPGQREADTQTGHARIATIPEQSGADGSRRCPRSSRSPSHQQPSPLKRGRPASPRAASMDAPPASTLSPDGEGALIHSVYDLPMRDDQRAKKPRRKAGDGSGLGADETHYHVARSVDLPASQVRSASQLCDAGGDGGVLVQFAPDDQKTSDKHAAAISEVRALYKRRVQWHRAEKRLTLQCAAICRGYVGGDKDEAGKLLARIEKGKVEPEALDAIIATAPLLAARGLLRTERLGVEKTLEKLAKGLPAFAFVQSVRGFGALSFAQVVGECGDIGSYKSVSAVWKRMGLAVIEGGRQRKVAGDAALDHGYSPERRSIMWNIASCMIKAQGTDGPYRAFYDQDKAKQLAKLAEGLPEGKEPSKLHAHNRACRHMTKRLLRDLFVAWRRETIVATEPNRGLSPANLIPAEAGADAAQKPPVIQPPRSGISNHPASDGGAEGHSLSVAHSCDALGNPPPAREGAVTKPLPYPNHRASPPADAA